MKVNFSLCLVCCRSSPHALAATRAAVLCSSLYRVIGRRSSRRSGRSVNCASFARNTPDAAVPFHISSDAVEILPRKRFATKWLCVWLVANRKKHRLITVVRFSDRHSGLVDSYALCAIVGAKPAERCVVPTADAAGSRIVVDAFTFQFFLSFFFFWRLAATLHPRCE